MNCLVPEVFDLKNYPCLPLDVESFRNSSFWIKSNDVQKIAYINLLLTSCYQISAVSLPNDQLLLEHVAVAIGLWNQFNQLCHEYNLASYEASMAGRKLRYEGQVRKPQLQKQINDLNDKIQLKLEFDKV